MQAKQCSRAASAGVAATPRCQPRRGTRIVAHSSHQGSQTSEHEQQAGPSRRGVLALSAALLTAAAQQPPHLAAWAEELDVLEPAAEAPQVGTVRRRRLPPPRRAAPKVTHARRSPL